MNDIKPTAAQLTLWHGVTALISGSAVSSSMAVVQYTTAHGVNIGQDVSYGLLVLLAAIPTLAVSIYHLVQSSPVLPQAEKDTEAQAQQVGEHVIQQLGPWFQVHFANVMGSLKGMEQSLANHAHVPVPTPLAPSSVPQLPFQITNASVPTTPPASTSMLNTFPLIPSVPKQ